METSALPLHLKKYVTEQDYSRYTNIDQAVWRFIMRRLKEYLSTHAHECYVDGLSQTGISTEYIPKIREMSEKLSHFGWRAVAVSGFIPPAAFMELQSLSLLPIACDMRTLEHAMYTPAPDIVHEAAGHAPILLNSEFSKYLQEYSQVAKKAILNKEDLDIYEAIRILSDLKEDPNSTEEQIKSANDHLHSVSQKATEPSEAALLARMNWWTAEYGLIGDLENPKIYGAGLLSSVGESSTALQSKTKKIPFSLKCLDFSYDITEPQPQLFVTPSFEHLIVALNEFANTMAFKTGGMAGLEKAKKSCTLNTVELSSGIQISGVLKQYSLSEKNQPIYLQFEGPCQLSFNDRELKGQGKQQHPSGFGTPLGHLKNSEKSLSDFTSSDFKKHNIELNQKSDLHFESGVVVSGIPTQVTSIESKNIILSFKDCRVTNGSQVLFDPSWGVFDMAVGHDVTSVFAGPADRDSYGETIDFIAKKVVAPKRSASFLALNEIFGQIRKLRESFHESQHSQTENTLGNLIYRLNKDFPTDWLTRLEILEICVKNNLNPKGLEDIQNFITAKSQEKSDEGQSLLEGFKLIEKGL